MSLGHTGFITVEKDRELFCDTCGARCTRSINGDLECGHVVGCPHCLDQFTTGTADSAYNYTSNNTGTNWGMSM